MVSWLSKRKKRLISDRLRHLLNGLDGSYLHCEKRLSDAGPSDLIWFEDAKREKVAEYLRTPDMTPYVAALERTAAIIDGFESPLGLESLATVDWLVFEGEAEPSVQAVREALLRWPGGTSAAQRKKRLIDDRLVALALKRLGEAGLTAPLATSSAN